MSDTEAGASAGASRIRMPLMIAVGVLVVAALAYFLVLAPNQGDGVEDVDQTQVVVGSEPAAVGSEPIAAAPGEAGTEQASEAPSEAPEEPSFEVFSARDPFDPLVEEDSGTGGGVETTTPSNDTVTETEPTQNGGSSGEPGEPGESAQAEVGVTTIRLDEVFREGGEEKVIVEVNSDGYEAAEGETVADGLTVLDIADSCATMRFDGTRFILCEGERIEK